MDYSPLYCPTMLKICHLSSPALTIIHTISKYQINSQTQQGCFHPQIPLLGTRIHFQLSLTHIWLASKNCGSFREGGVSDQLWENREIVKQVVKGHNMTLSYPHKIRTSHPLFTKPILYMFQTFRFGFMHRGAMFGSLFASRVWQEGECCGKSRRVGTKTETTATQFMANRSTSNHNSLNQTPTTGWGN